MRIEKVVITAFYPAPKGFLTWEPSQTSVSFSLWLRFRELFLFLKLHLKLPWDMMLGGGAPRWQIKDRIKGNRPCSAQAQLDTPIPPACPESHSSRSSSSLEHSAEDTMSSVVCRERETFILLLWRGCLLAHSHSVQGYLC